MQPSGNNWKFVKCFVLCLCGVRAHHQWNLIDSRAHADAESALFTLQPPNGLFCVFGRVVCSMCLRCDRIILKSFRQHLVWSMHGNTSLSYLIPVIGHFWALKIPISIVYSGYTYQRRLNLKARETVVLGPKRSVALDLQFEKIGWILKKYNFEEGFWLWHKVFLQGAQKKLLSK